MPEHHKLDYIELPANDFDKQQAFYETVFGWTFTDYGADYRAFNDDNMDGGFYRSDLVSRTANGAALVILYSNDLEASVTDIKKAGGTILVDIFSFPGGRRFQFLDPHGNELAVWSNP